MDIGSFPHQVTRLVFDTGQPYDEFRARYEAAVPALDEKRLAEFAARGAAWPEVVADADASAPHGFLIFWRLDTAPVMSLAGNSTRCTAYLMGNHTIAERMYRHDPAVMLYVPLRTVIYAGSDDRVLRRRPAQHRGRHLRPCPGHPGGRRPRPQAHRLAPRA